MTARPYNCAFTLNAVIREAPLRFVGDQTLPWEEIETQVGTARPCGAEDIQLNRKPIQQEVHRYEQNRTDLVDIPQKTNVLIAEWTHPMLMKFHTKIDDPAGVEWTLVSRAPRMGTSLPLSLWCVAIVQKS